MNSSTIHLIVMYSSNRRKHVLIRTSFPRCFKYIICSCILIKRFAFVSHSQASCSIITLCYKLIPDINSKFCTFVQSLSFSLAVNTVLLDKCS